MDRYGHHAVRRGGVPGFCGEGQAPPLGLADPGCPGIREERLRAFRHTRDELRLRLEVLFAGRVQTEKGATPRGRMAPGWQG